MTALSENLTAEQLDLLVVKAGGREQVLKILSGALELRPASADDDQATAAPSPVERRVIVPAGPGFEERVARGRYGWRHKDMTEERFPVTEDQIGEREQKIFHFARSISSDDAIRQIRAAGFAPARIGDILVFGEAYPTEQRNYPVIGLGSVALVDQKPSVPALWFDGERRTLDLIWYDGDWHRNYRFLGVR